MVKTMNNLRQNFTHGHWGSIVGNEKGIRLAVLKDEVELWEERIGDDPDHIPYLRYIKDTLKSRIKEIMEEK